MEERIDVNEFLPGATTWPLAIMMRPESTFGEWHVYAVAKMTNQAFPMLKAYAEEFPLGTWAVVDRLSGKVLKKMPAGAWIAPQ